MVESGLNPQARVRLEWRGALPENTWETRSRLYGVGDVLETMLREQLREDLGGVYGVAVSASEDVPLDTGTRSGSSSAVIRRVDELVAATEGWWTRSGRGGRRAYVEDEKEKNRRAGGGPADERVLVGGVRNTVQRGADPMGF